jgi:hypothetical protein
MTASFDDTPELLTRMQGLEAELEQLKRSLVGRTLSARAFVLTNKGGLARGWFAVSEDGNPELKLAASDGSVRVELMLDSSDAPRITMYDEDGKQRAALQVGDTGEPSIYLWDGSGVNMTALRTLDDGSCEVVLNGGVEGRLRLATNSQGAAQIELVGEDDRTRVAIRSGESRPAEIMVLDSVGDPRIELFLDSNDATGLKLYDYMDNRRLSVELDEIGTPRVALLDSEEIEIAVLQRGDEVDDEEEEEDADDEDDEEQEDEEEEEAEEDEAQEGQGAPTTVSAGSGFRTFAGVCKKVVVKDDRVAALIYPSDLVEIWQKDRQIPRKDIKVFARAFTYDNDLVIAAMGIATRFTWSTTPFGQRTEHIGVALHLIVLNRGEMHIKGFNVSNIVLVDDRGHQYSSTGGFYWTDADRSFHQHATDITGKARQEGFVLFPAMRIGSTRFTKCVLRELYFVGAEYGESTFEIALK